MEGDDGEVKDRRDADDDDDDDDEGSAPPTKLALLQVRHVTAQVKRDYFLFLYLSALFFILRRATPLPPPRLQGNTQEVALLHSYWFVPTL